MMAKSALRFLLLVVMLLVAVQQNGCDKNKKKGSNKSNKANKSNKSNKASDPPSPEPTIIQLLVGKHAEQGKRKYMEDFYTFPDVAGDDSWLALGVFDGHGGKKCAAFANEKLLPAMTAKLPKDPDATLSPEAFRKAAVAAYEEVDTDFLETSSKEHGSTALTIHVKGTQLYVANAGDTRAVLAERSVGSGRGLSAQRLSVDHKGTDPAERKRVEALGGKFLPTPNHGYVVCPGIRGDWKSLAVTRALGDAACKVDPRPVISTPATRRVDLTSAHRFVIAATDGLWDVFSDDAAVHHCEKVIAEEPTQKQLNECAKKLVDAALKKGSRDNISVMVLGIKWGTPDKASRGGA